MDGERTRSRHNRNAPYWAGALIVLLIVGLAPQWFELGNFFSGYALDIAGPAWSYILFRGLFTAHTDNAWTRFFSPSRTLVIFLLVCFGIETGQYFKLYDATFDPWDLVAYCSLLVPLYALDRLQSER